MDLNRNAKKYDVLKVFDKYFCIYNHFIIIMMSPALYFEYAVVDFVTMHIDFTLCKGLVGF